MENVENNRENKVFEFAQFSFDLKEKILRRDSETISLPPKSCELLAVLLENSGRLLTKEELFEKVWANTFVEEANLSHHIAVLRKALGKDNNGRKFIETVPRRGYRFIAKVNEVLKDSLEITFRESTLTRIIEEQEIEFFPEDFSPKFIADNSQTNKRKKIIWGSLTFFLLMVAIVVFYWKFFSKSEIIFQPSNLKRLTFSGRAAAAKISPDGRYIAYIQRDDNERSIWIRQIATGSDIRITSPVSFEDIYGTISFSQDGNYVYYSLKRKGEKFSTLYQVPTLGGNPKKILENLTGAITFSPDGKRLAFFRPSLDSNDLGLFTANIDGTDEKSLASRKRPNHFNGSISWSADGKKILCSVFETTDGFHYEFIAVQADSGEMQTIRSKNWQSAESVVWMPDGKSFLLLGQAENSATNQIWQISYPSGETKQITNDTNHYGSLGLTADGKSLVAGKLNQEAHIFLIKSQPEKDIQPITNGEDNFDGLNGIGWTANKNIIYHSKASGKDEIWMMDADGKNSRKIADGGNLTVSPDNRFVVFQGKENNIFGLFRININDGSLKRLTEGIDFTPTFSPDGKTVYFSRFQNQTNLWFVSSEGGEAKLFNEEFRTTSSPTVSPDGKILALAYGKMVKKKDAPSGIALINIENNQIIKTFEVPEFKFGSFYEQPTLQWTADGKAVNFIVLQNGVSNIWQQPITGGNRVQVTNFTDGRIFNFAFSKDGQQIALSRGKITSDVFIIENTK